MIIVKAPVEFTKEIQHNIILQKVFAPEIASDTNPGEFCNLKVSESNYPLLRRPFSICDVEGDYIYFMYNITGEGTAILSRKKKGDIIDVLGPLGKGFGYNSGYEKAVIVAGGLGAAPFPFLTRRIPDDKEIFSFVGGRSREDVITHGLKNVFPATDDGSLGFKGTVVDLVKDNLDVLKAGKSKVFSCGPNPMLRALKDLCIENDLDCEVSIECAMACGFGICQGCPIESTQDDTKYKLVCKDGPVFKAGDVVI